jgi:hypothetical protein
MSIDFMPAMLLSVLGQTQASICASKAETVGEGHLHIMFLCVLGHVIAVKVLWRIAWLVQVESRRHYTLRRNRVSRWTSRHAGRKGRKQGTHIPNSQYRENRFNSTRRSQQMSHRTLRTADVNLRRPLLAAAFLQQQPLDRPVLRGVAQSRRSGVRIHVVDIARLDLCVPQSAAHGEVGAFAVFARSSHVVGVG